MYFFPHAAVEAVLETGMRAAFGMIVIDFPTAYASDPDDYLAKGLALRDRYRDHPLLSFCLAPHAPYTVSDRTFGKVATMAAELDCPIHCHVHETEDEIARSVAEHGVRPLERLRSLGIVGPNLISVHSVHLTPGEIDLLASHGSSVAHCPSSNLKLASGFAPVAALIARGVNVALGTDGAASNNRLDAFQEMRQAEFSREVTKASWTVQSAASFGHDLARAMQIARSGRPGPVHLSLPVDLLDEQVALVDSLWPSDAAAARVVTPLTDSIADLVLVHVAAASRPLILCGPTLCSVAGRASMQELSRRTALVCKVCNFIWWHQ